MSPNAQICVPLDLKFDVHFDRPAPLKGIDTLRKTTQRLGTWRMVACLFALIGVGTVILSAERALASGCGASPAHEAFTVQGLKSELMVTALSCGAQDQYNAFVNKFRPKLAAEELRLSRYFKSTYGRRAAKAQDDYITQLANVQSAGGLKAGTIFCKQRVPMFEEVSVLEDGADLARYADAKDIVQPASFETCSAPEAERLRRPGRLARHRPQRQRHH